MFPTALMSGTPTVHENALSVVARLSKIFVLEGELNEGLRIFVKP